MDMNHWGASWALRVSEANNDPKRVDHAHWDLRADRCGLDSRTAALLVIEGWFLSFNRCGFDVFFPGCDIAVFGSERSCLSPACMRLRCRLMWQSRIDLISSGK